MRITGSTALVTGSTGGLGRAIAVELIARGAKVYATARRPELVAVPGAIPLRVDITDQDSIDAAAALAPDVDLLVNNGASMLSGSLLTDDLDLVRSLMDTHFYGTLRMIRAFAPILGRNGGGGILNVLSLTAWQPNVTNAALAAAKSAQWGLTNNIRLELADQGTLVSSLVAGLIDVPALRAFLDGQDLAVPAHLLTDPASLARHAIDGIEAGRIEILDPLSAVAKSTMSGPPVPFDLSRLAPSP